MDKHMIMSYRGSQNSKKNIVGNFENIIAVTEAH